MLHTENTDKTLIESGVKHYSYSIESTNEVMSGIDRIITSIEKMKTYEQLSHDCKSVADAFVEISREDLRKKDVEIENVKISRDLEIEKMKLEMEKRIYDFKLKYDAEYKAAALDQKKTEIKTSNDITQLQESIGELIQYKEIVEENQRKRKNQTSTVDNKNDELETLRAENSKLVELATRLSEKCPGLPVSEGKSGAQRIL